MIIVEGLDLSKIDSESLGLNTCLQRGPGLHERFTHFLFQEHWLAYTALFLRKSRNFRDPYVYQVWYMFPVYCSICSAYIQDMVVSRGTEGWIAHRGFVDFSEEHI